MSRSRTVEALKDRPGPAMRPAPLAIADLVSPKIQAYHLERLAIVYIRQSTPYQVQVNVESTARQYALWEYAVALGWPRERVLIIDEDQGQTGRSAEKRTGFHRLLDEVTMGRVGLVVGLEMSRLARSNKDWHHLLEVCALCGTLLADQDGVYDPHDPNDRLVLGLRGTISEVELHTMRNRLERGRLNKAKRGALFSTAPIGYVRVPSGELALDPDEQVQSVVRLTLDKFAELQSAAGLLRYMVDNGIKMGVRHPNGRVPGPIQWRHINQSTLLQMLHNPVYAGLYGWGQHTSDPRRIGPNRRRSKRLPMDEWQVVLKDKLPAYISWERFQANQEILKANHARIPSPGSARNGQALLPGLLFCGRCGSRLVVSYKKNGKIFYNCCQRARSYGEEFCQFFQGNPLEQLVSEKILRVLEPAAIELSLQAAEDVQKERSRLHKNWQQRLERARYETDRAARQYHAVEPENRLVARTLEKRWESALREQQQLEEDYDRFRQEQPRELTTEDIARIRALAKDVPELWNSVTTTPQDRKVIVRHLIERVVVKGEKHSEYVDMTIHWAGGYVSNHEVMRPVGSFDHMRDFAAFKKRALELHFSEHSYQQIADKLIQEGFHSPKGLDHFDPENIRAFLQRYCAEELGPNHHAIRQHIGPNEMLTSELAREINVPQATLRYWARRGWVHYRIIQGIGRCIFWADKDEIKRLKRLRACPAKHGGKVPAYPEELVTPKKRPPT